MVGTDRRAVRCGALGERALPGSFDVTDCDIKLEVAICDFKFLNSPVES